VLVIANASPIGSILQTEADYAVAVYRAGKYLTQLEYTVFLAAHTDNSTIAWWVAVAVLTGFAIWLGRVFVSIWGAREPESDHRANNLGLQAVAKAMALPGSPSTRARR
jgi:hypothetical protein